MGILRYAVLAIIAGMVAAVAPIPQLIRKEVAVSASQFQGDRARTAFLDQLPPEIARAVGGLAQAPRNAASEKVSCLQVANTTRVDLLHADKYADRAANGQCDQPAGMWKSNDTAEVRLSKYRTMAKLLGLTAHHTVLDWGTGCGKELNTIAGEVGFTAFGADVVKPVVDWASQHGTHATYCLADEHKLPFQDGMFDAVVSNAALYHLNGLERETAGVNEMLRVLRPGGCGWMAWLGEDDDKVSMQAWNYVDVAGASVIAFNEAATFKSEEYGTTEAYSLLFCKDKGNATATISSTWKSSIVNGLAWVGRYR